MVTTVHIERSALQLKAPFRIAGHVFDTSPIVTVTIRDGDHIGRGEASGVFFLDDDADHICTQLDTVRSMLSPRTTREELRALLAPGGARNAVDCAFWELEAARAGMPVWALAGLAAPRL